VTEPTGPARGGPTATDAYAVAASVPDPELPDLTLADLGILRDVRVESGRVVVTITPTYLGCPAMTEMRHDVRARLHDAGFADVDVRTALDPAWSSDWISAAGRRKLAAAGIAPPPPAPGRGTGPIPLTLGRQDGAAATRVACPRCGSPHTTRLSAFGATACRALDRCTACGEPFESVKAL
jgi:ring-1,2-phenylacetyl-CoA epoxidase subunit PaaD